MRRALFAALVIAYLGFGMAWASVQDSRWSRVCDVPGGDPVVLAVYTVAWPVIWLSRELRGRIWPGEAPAQCPRGVNK